MIDRQIALDAATRHARGWLDSLATRPAPPRASVAEVAKALGTELPDGRHQRMRSSTCWRRPATPA
jgi:hypothetical protein